MVNISFEERIVGMLANWGMAGLEVLSSKLLPAFGDAEVVVKAGAICMRFVRERGQEFVDVQAPGGQGKYFQYCDLEVAMGWKPDPDVGRDWPEPLEDVLARLGSHLPELSVAFSPLKEADTLARLEMARERRVTARAARWQRLSAEASKKR